MRFAVDSYFSIGAAHVVAGSPCQDYAVSGADRDWVCAVVSDGCSTGGRTDVGSRIVGLATIEACRIAPSRLAITANQNYILAITRDGLGLRKNDLLATCLYVRVDGQGAYFHLQGDGVIATKRSDGSIAMTRFDWANNTPFYPAYTPNGDEEAFFAAHGGRESFGLIAECLDQNGASEKLSFTATEGVNGISFWIDLNKVEFAAVFSDGVTQIDGVNWEDAVTELMNFKNVTGEFVKRRSMAALRKFKETGKGPVDDFSMAVIHVNHDE